MPKISELTEATTYDTTDYIAMVDVSESLTKRILLTRLSGGVKYLSNYASFAAALTSISTTETTLVIDTTATISANTTVASTISLIVLNTGLLSHSTYTLTISGQLDAGPYQIFSGSGTVTLSGVVTSNLKWFGATGGGTTDDSAAVTQWLGCGAKALYAPAGTYIVSGDATTLRVIPSNTKVYGDGIGITTFKLKDTAGASAIEVFYTEDGGTDITISDMTLDGNRDNQSWAIVGSANYGLAVRSSKTTVTRVEAKEVTANGMGVPTNAFDVVFDGCISHDNGKKGFHSGDVNRIKIVNCTAYNNETDAAIGMHAGMTEAVIANNILYDNYQGIRIGATTGAYPNSRRVSITGNVIYGNDDAGISIGNNSTSDTVLDMNIAITGNTFYDNLYSLVSSSSYGGVVTGNVFADSNSYNIWLYNGSQRWTIAGNQILNGCKTDAKAGIWLASSATVKNNIITNNYLYDNQDTPTQVTGIVIGAGTTGNLIADNIIENATTNAIDNDSTNFGDNIIRNNIPIGSGNAEGNSFSGKHLARSSSTVSTSGTGEDNLKSATVTANSMGLSNGIKVTAWGGNVGANGNKTVKFYFGATAFTVIPADNNQDSWRVEITLYNTSATAQRGWATAWRGTTEVYSSYITAAIDTTADVTVKLTGECANASDTVSQYSMLAEYL